ncbi:MAG: diguanylate cyclase [Pseudomonadota bacterium]
MTMDNAGLPFRDEDLCRLLDHLPDAILLCEAGGRVLTANRPARQLFDRSLPIPEHVVQLVPELDEWGPEGLLTMAEAGELNATFEYPTTPMDSTPGLSLSLRASCLRNSAGDHRVLVSMHDISEERQLQERLRALSMTDELTRIPNRRFLGSTLAFEEERARRFNRMLFVMFFDIDKFKEINDVHGHLLGDRAICHFATILMKNVRKIDTVCRWGGDEFVVLGLCTSTDGALTLLHRLFSALERSPLAIGGEVVILRASVGMTLACYGPEATMYGDRLVAEADALMLQVKETPGLQYLVGEVGPRTVAGKTR